MSEPAIPTTMRVEHDAIVALIDQFSQARLNEEDTEAADVAK